MSKGSSTLAVIARFFFNYVVFAMLLLQIFFIILCSTNIKNYTEVWEKGESTQATVKWCGFFGMNSLNDVELNYEIDGKEYNTKSVMDKKEVDKINADGGSGKAEVHYDPEKPETAYAESFIDTVKALRTQYIIYAVIFGVITLVWEILKIRAKNRYRSELKKRMGL